MFLIREHINLGQYAVCFFIFNILEEAYCYLSVNQDTLYWVRHSRSLLLVYILKEMIQVPITSHDGWVNSGHLNNNGTSDLGMSDRFILPSPLSSTFSSQASVFSDWATWHLHRSTFLFGSVCLGDLTMKVSAHLLPEIGIEQSLTNLI